jgi:transposase
MRFLNSSNEGMSKLIRKEHNARSGRAWDEEVIRRYVRNQGRNLEEYEKIYEDKLST